MGKIIQALTFRNIFNILFIIFILSIIPIGVYLVKQQQVLKSRAGGERSVVFFGEGVREENGQYIATRLDGIRVRLTSPIVQATPSASPRVSICQASNVTSFRSCIDQVNNNQTDRVEVRGTITCSGANTCNFHISNVNRPVTIYGTAGSGFRRTDWWGYNILDIENSSQIEVKDLTFDENQNVTSCDESPTSEGGIRCSGTVNVYHSNDIILNNLDIRYSKRMGIMASSNRNLTIKNSHITGVTTFGIWFFNNPQYLNQNVTIENNTISDNASNGILFSAAGPSLIKGNTFIHNHHDTVFHVCGSSGHDPCSGGQLLIEQPLSDLRVEDNIIRDGRIDDPEENNTGYVTQGIELTNSNLHNIIMIGNRITNNSGNGIIINDPVSDITNISITGNTIVGNRRGAIYFPGANISDNCLNEACSNSSPSGTISASPNPCTIPAGSTICRSTITWSTTNAASVQVRVQPGNGLFSINASGSQVAPWIGREPATLQLYSGTTLLSSLAVSAIVPSPTPTPAPVNLLRSDMQNWSIKNEGSQNVQWFAEPGTYTISGTATSSPILAGENPTLSMILVDEYTNEGQFLTSHLNNSSFTIASGHKFAVILRALNAQASFTNVSLSGTATSDNLLPVDTQNATVAYNGDAGQSQKVQWFDGENAVGTFNLTGNVSGDGLIFADEYNGSAFVDNHLAGSSFTIPSGHKFAVILRTRSGSATYSNVGLIKSSPSQNLLRQDMQNWSIKNEPSQNVQWFAEPGIYTISGTTTSNPIIVGTRDVASVVTDEYTNEGGFVSTHLNNTTFTIPQGHKFAVIMRAINSDARFSSVSLTRGNVQGIAIAAEHPYTTSFKIAKSQQELQNAPAQDYDSDPKYIDFTFSNKAPGTTETMFVEFIGKGGEKQIQQMTITYQPPATPGPVISAPPAPTLGTGQPPKDFSHIRSVTFYDVWSPNTNKDSGYSYNAIVPQLPAIKDAGFNTVWVTNPWMHYNPKPLANPPVYNDASFAELTRVLQLLKDNGMKAILPLDYLGEGWSPEGIDACKWSVDPAMYRSFETYVTAFLRRIEPYHDMVYILLFTEGAEPCSLKGDSTAVASALQSTLGSLPSRLPANLRSEFTFGYHDYSLINLGESSSSLFPSPIPYDFLSMVAYGLNKKTNDELRQEIDQRANRFRSLYPQTPLIIGEFGASTCTPYDEDNQLRVDQTIISQAIERGYGFNLWGWASPPSHDTDCQAPEFGGLGLTNYDGSFRKAINALKNALAPVISSAGVNQQYNPWAVWVTAKKTNADTKVRFFDRGNQWGSDQPLIGGSKGEGGTVALPSNTPPSRCNQNSSCQIAFKLVDTTGALSNEYTLTLSKAPASAGNIIQDIINKIIPTPEPIATPVPTPISQASPSTVAPVVTAPPAIPTPIPASTPIPPSGPIETIAQVLVKPLENIVPDIPIISQLIAAPTPTPVPTSTFLPQAAYDINGDGKVNAADLSTIFSGWGKKTTEVKNPKADLNNDGAINTIDYTLFLKSYKK